MRAVVKIAVAVLVLSIVVVACVRVEQSMAVSVAEDFAKEYQEQQHSSVGSVEKKTTDWFGAVCWCYFKIGERGSLQVQVVTSKELWGIPFGIGRRDYHVASWDYYEYAVGETPPGW